MLRDLLFKPRAAAGVSSTTLGNMRWMLFDGIFAASSLAIINTYYTLYLESLGATSTQIGLMASLTNLLLLLTVLPGAWITEKIGSRKRAVLFGSGGISRIFLLVSALLPLWFKEAAAILPIIFARLLVDNFNLLSQPAWTSLSADIVPMEQRGSYFSLRNLLMSISSMLTVLVIGRLIFAIGRPGGYQVALFIAFAVGMIATFCYSRIREPQKEAAEHQIESYSPAALVATLKEDHNLRNFCLFLLMWNGSISIAGPFFAIYLVRELNATPDIVGVLTMIATLSGLPATYLFGKLMDRWGGWKSMALAGFFIPLLPWLWLLARDAWGTTFAYFYDGIAWSSYTLASFGFMLTLASPLKLTRYNAIAQVMVALASTLGAILGGVMVTAWGYRAVFAISGAGRLLSMLFFIRFVKPSAEHTERRSSA